MIHCDDPFLKMLDETRWHKPPRKRRDLRSTDCERVASLAKSFRLAEACASRTHRRQGDLPPAGFEDRA